MWSEPEFPYKEVDSALRPLLIWQRRPPRFLHPYARPPEMSSPFMKSESNLIRIGIPSPPFRLPRLPIEFATPHAGPSLPHLSLRSVRPDVPLYQDFSAPPRPTPININVQTSALVCSIDWKTPAIEKMLKYTYKLEVWEGVKCDTYDFPANVLSYKLKTTPGTIYKLELTARDPENSVIALGTARVKAVFSTEEMHALYKKSLDFVGTVMHSFRFLYRCKPKIYYDDIQFHRGGIMEKYVKDNNGQAASSINGAISGLFFSARLLPDGNLPTHSPFGNVRMLVPAMTLLDPSRVNMYFCDFYCNYITHYVTVVICEKHSDTDMFCLQRLIKLVPDSNPFLRIIFRPPMFEPEFWVNKNVWVEIYYTENVPLNWGRFDAITATGAGTSRVGGLPHNKHCHLCNLYPLKNTSVAKIASSKLNSTFELLLNLERERLGNESISDSADLIETICIVIDSVVQNTSQDAETECCDQECEEEKIENKRLKSPQEIMEYLDRQDLCEEMQNIKKYLKTFVSEMDNNVSKIEYLLNEAKLFSLHPTFSEIVPFMRPFNVG
ncbi:unnamed protein product [Thelazia callipaeda]|uniref:PHYHIP_C domain-containing protein n=1 Tax=Thelazia callipaeda TaxID=103827 RepID=A0A0N5CYI0_THECL|nr:unnamed protein product [Thelazia callipaeda]